MTTEPADPNRIRVLVADAQYLLAESLGRSLAQWPDLEVVPEHPVTALDVLEAVVSWGPDVTLLDYWMPDMQGGTATTSVLARSPRQKVLVLSWFCGSDHVEASLKAGAVGFMPKSVTVDQVAEGVRRAHAGERPVFRESLERLMQRLSRRCEERDVRVEGILRLTPRELKILAMLGAGSSVPEVASHLSITPGTLRTYIHTILQKLDVGSQREAIAIVQREGLISS